MATTALIVVFFLALLATHLRAVLLGQNKKLAWFYSACFAVSFVVLVLHSMGIPLYGPSQLVLDFANALSLPRI